MDKINCRAAISHIKESNYIEAPRGLTNTAWAQAHSPPLKKSTLETRLASAKAGTLQWNLLQDLVGAAGSDMSEFCKAGTSGVNQHGNENV